MSMGLQRSIEEKVHKMLSPTVCEVVNESHLHSAGRAESHFKVLIASDVFVGLSRVQRQQKVYQLLADELQNGVHALSLRLLTVEEWNRGEGQGFQTPQCQSKK